MKIHFDENNDEKIKFLMFLFASIIGFVGSAIIIVVPNKFVYITIIFIISFICIYQLLEKGIATKRKKYHEILKMLSEGQNYEKIASQLNISEAFVEEVAKRTSN